MGAMKPQTISQAIRAAGHVQRNVANDAGIDYFEFNRIANGHSVPDKQQIKAIRRVFLTRRIPFDFSGLSRLWADASGLAQK